MGTWGTGAFENDDSADWLSELADAGDVSFLVRALSRVNDNEGYLEAPDCCLAIAAAEVVAAVRGRPAAGVPEEVRDFGDRTRLGVSLDLLAAARTAVQRVKTKSELRDLWDEAGADEWLGSIADLESRLA